MTNLCRRSCRKRYVARGNHGAAYELSKVIDVSQAKVIWRIFRVLRSLQNCRGILLAQPVRDSHLVVSPGGSTIPLLMLAALLKLGVLKPAGASVADFAATLASPVPNVANIATTQEERRSFLPRGMDMSVPPKKAAVYARGTQAD